MITHLHDHTYFDTTKKILIIIWYYHIFQKISRVTIALPRIKIRHKYVTFYN